MSAPKKLSKTLEELAQIARKSLSKESLEELWLAIFVRKAWYLLPATDGATTPLVIDDNTGVILPIFTSILQLHRFQDAFFEANTDINLPRGSLPLSPYAAMTHIVDHQHLIDRVEFHIADDTSFSVSPEILDTYAKHFHIYDFPNRFDS